MRHSKRDVTLAIDVMFFDNGEEADADCRGGEVKLTRTARRHNEEDQEEGTDSRANEK